MLHLSIVPGDASTAVCLIGELDCAGVDAVASLIGSLDPARDTVVLDLTGLRFVDIAGSRALDDAVLDLTARGVDARLEGLTGAAARLRALVAELRDP